MVLSARTRQRSQPRGFLAAVIALAAVTVAFSVALPAAAAPGDQPSVHQYSDPFAPLGTGHRTPAWNPFGREFREAAPTQVRRRLAKTEDGAALDLLLAQLQTERVRTQQEGSESGADGAGAAGASAPREGDEPDAAGSAVSSVVDGGGPGGVLLLAGLGAVAAAGLAAVWGRRRHYAAAPRGR
jgi:hypothetical protein